VANAVIAVRGSQVGAPLECRGRAPAAAQPHLAARHAAVAFGVTQPFELLRSGYHGP